MSHRRKHIPPNNINTTKMNGAFIPTMNSFVGGWWDFDDTSNITISSGDVTAAVDKTGNGYDMSSAVDQYPSVVSMFNGRSGASFDGVDEYTVCTWPSYDSSAGDGATYYIVMTPRRADNQDSWIIDGTSAGSRVLWFNLGATTFQGVTAGGTTRYNTSNQWSQNGNIVTFLRIKDITNADEFAFQSNGTYELVGVPGTNNTTGITLCSSYDLGGSFGQYDIGEVIWVKADLHSSQSGGAENIRNYLLSKWNVDVGAYGG